MLREQYETRYRKHVMKMERKETSLGHGDWMEQGEVWEILFSKLYFDT